MDKISVRQYLIEFFRQPFPKIVPRDYKIPKTSKINVLVGARRVGKTYIQYEILQDLIGSGKNKLEQGVLYLNFEHPLLFQKIAYDEMHLLLELYWSIFPPKDSDKLVLFIDEPQAMDNWERAIRSLHDDYFFQVYLTGSSSSLLSWDISTILRGRTLTTWILPLSFKEYLNFKGITFDFLRLDTVQKAKLLSSLKEYFVYGGYPEVVKEEENLIKFRILKDYIDLTVYRDIVQRFSIRNVTIIQQIMEFIIVNTSNQMSIHKMFNHFKSQGHTINKNKFYEYISMLEDISFIHVVKKYNTNLRAVQASRSKFFLNDTGFLSLYSIDSLTRQLELHVFLHLKRQKNVDPTLQIYYWKTKEDWEVDFLLSSGGKITFAIQVTHSIGDIETEERELRSLAVCKKEFPDIEVLLITYDTETIKEKNGLKIPAVPFWKWVLDIE